MRRLLTASVLLLIPAALLCAADAPKGDKDLDGDWEQMSLIRDGQEAQAPVDGKTLLTVKGDSADLTEGSRTHSVAIKVDTSKTPRQIDMTPSEGPNKGQTALGIYEVKGDEVHICFTRPGGKDRPTELASKEGSGLTLITLKRVKK